MALRELLATFGFKIDSAPLTQVNAKIDQTKAKVKGLGKEADRGSEGLENLAKLAAGSFVFSRLKEGLNELRGMGSELRNTAVRLGLGTQEWQKWQLAGELAGVSSESLAEGIKHFEHNLSEANAGSKEQAAAFKLLGVDASGAVKGTTSLSDTLEATGLSIAGQKNAYDRTALAIKVFGRAGTALLPFFAKGKEGIHALLGELERLGGGLSDDAIEKLKQSGRASKEFDVATLSLKSSLTSALLPAITGIVRKGTEGLGIFRKLTGASKLLETAAVLLGAAGTVAAVSFLSPWLLAAGVFGGIALAVDDVWVAIEGGDSVIGRVVDQLYGKGTGESFFHTVKGELDDFYLRMGAAPTYTAKFNEAFSSVGYGAFKGLGVAWDATTLAVDAAIDAWIEGSFMAHVEKISKSIVMGILRPLNDIGEAARLAWNGGKYETDFGKQKLFHEEGGVEATGERTGSSRFVESHIAGQLDYTDTYARGAKADKAGTDTKGDAYGPPLDPTRQAIVATAAAAQVRYLTADQLNGVLGYAGPPSVGSVPGIPGPSLPGGRQSGGNTNHIDAHRDTTVNQYISTKDPRDAANRANAGLDTVLDQEWAAVAEAVEPLAPSN